MYDFRNLRSHKYRYRMFVIRNTELMNKCCSFGTFLLLVWICLEMFGSSPICLNTYTLDIEQTERVNFCSMYHNLLPINLGRVPYEYLYNVL
jgi:hypothetical protein